jgi:hypothetical protein
MMSKRLKLYTCPCGKVTGWQWEDDTPVCADCLMAYYKTEADRVEDNLDATAPGEVRCE